MHRVKEVVKLAELRFPVKEALDKVPLALGGVEAGEVKDILPAPIGEGEVVEEVAEASASERVIRAYAGSTRPDHIWPELWTMMSRKSKQVAIEEAAARKAKGEESLPTPAVVAKVVMRVIIEFCCGETSTLGLGIFLRDGCLVYRLTIKDDLVHYLAHIIRRREAG